MEIGDMAYAFRWLQEGHTTETTSARRFSSLEEVEALVERLNRRWLPHLIHWPVTYEAKVLQSGKKGWVEEKEGARPEFQKPVCEVLSPAGARCGGPAHWRASWSDRGMYCCDGHRDDVRAHYDGDHDYDRTGLLWFDVKGGFHNEDVHRS